MLQRAASNAYSWWWASHIRTKQSKWLEQSLIDMEDKVNSTLKIIDDDGDSFAKRAEMYYRKRPELVNFVEESYRAYRALAERYDHLSRELQSANRTIASVFPEQVQLSIDDEDEENISQTSTSAQNPHKQSNSKLSIIPKVPNVPNKEFRTPSALSSRRGQLNRSSSSAKHIIPPSSGLTKMESLEELDKLQKGILALQTEKEFVKSSYEHTQAKYWEIENQIIEMQSKVCSLQDEFGIGTVIDDNEARSLMAATALKSCQETLVKLQEKQDQSSEEARVEQHRIRDAHEKFASLKQLFGSKKTELSATEDLELKHLDEEITSGEKESQELDLLKEKIMEQFAANSNSPLTVMKLAEKIDELVDKVVHLETEVSSQTALVKTLRSETDNLHAHIRSLEEKKGTLMEGSDNMSNKLRELEEELVRVKKLNQSVRDQNNNLQTHFTEANCNIEHLSEKLQTIDLVEEVENAGLFQEVKIVLDAKPDKGTNKATGENLGNSKDTKIQENVPLHIDSAKTESNPSHKIDIITEKPEELKQDEKDEKKEVSGDSEPEEMGTEEEEDQPNWRKLFVNGLEDREKILLEEYTSVFQNYKEVRRKLNEVEKKNQDGLFDLAMQIRELKSVLALKDEEIQRLKMNTPRKFSHESTDNSTEYSFSNLEGPNESSPDSSFSFQSTRQQPLFRERSGESPLSKDLKRLPSEEEEDKTKHRTEPNAVSSIEEKLRLEIDRLLEENLEFWLRFSTSFHQIQKFQNSFRDLKAELSKLRYRKLQEGNMKNASLNSDGRPIYKHMREIQTELTLWVENNSILKDEMHGRHSLLCSIQEKIARVCSTHSTELSTYQAAKFQGELRNMKQENFKVAEELQAGLNCVRLLQEEVGKTLAKLDEDLGISASKTHYSQMRSSSRPRIPLRSFLFGVKLKKQRQQKQSVFSCMSPALQKQHSDLAPRPIDQ